MGRGISGGRLLGENDRVGHVQKYGDREITVGDLYIDCSHRCGRPMCRVTSAYPRVLGVEYQHGGVKTFEGVDSIYDFLLGLVSSSKKVAEERISRLKKEVKTLRSWI